MNKYNVFEIIIAVLFVMIPQLGRLEPKSQYLVTSFSLGEGENIPKLHLRALQIRSERLLLQDETGKINNLTGK